jgi:hypothetical protein
MFQTTYFVGYSLICALLTAGLAVTLHRTARLLTGDRAGGNARLTLSVARLLAGGFYLACGGYFAMTCPTNWRFSSLGEVAHVISVKAGLFLLLLGAIDVVNLLILAVVRRQVQEAA